MTDHPTPAETRRILLGITSPAEDVERRAIDAGILRRNWRDIAASKEDDRD